MIDLTMQPLAMSWTKSKRINWGLMRKVTSWAWIPFREMWIHVNTRTNLLLVVQSKAKGTSLVPRQRRKRASSAKMTAQTLWRVLSTLQMLERSMATSLTERRLKLNLSTIWSIVIIFGVLLTRCLQSMKRLLPWMKNVPTEEQIAKRSKVQQSRRDHPSRGTAHYRMNRDREVKRSN